jgi:RNA polymerase sigma-70 factor (ECF subfamily)
MENILDSALSDTRALTNQNAESSQEAAWVASSQRGDAVSFNRLVLKWERPIYNLSLRMLRDADEAAEATQEVFLLAFKGIRRFRLDAQFSTWLYRIAANHCTSRLRKRPPGVHLSLDGSQEGTEARQRLAATECPEREFFRQESDHKVRRALEYLQPEQRIVVELKFFHEMTFEQIALVVEAPLSTVKSRLYHGLEILKIRLVRGVVRDQASMGGR